MALEPDYFSLAPQPRLKGLWLAKNMMFLIPNVALVLTLVDLVDSLNSNLVLNHEGNLKISTMLKT